MYYQKFQISCIDQIEFDILTLTKCFLHFLKGEGKNEKTYIVTYNFFVLFKQLNKNLSNGCGLRCQDYKEMG